MALQAFQDPVFLTPKEPVFRNLPVQNSSVG